MKLKLIPIGLSLAVAVAFAASTLPGQAQNVNVTTSLSYVAGTGSVYDYTLLFNNTGPESVESYWLGWVPGSFNVASPSNPGNNLGWTSTLDGNSVQYLGTSGTALAAGHSGTFTFDSTTTPAQFIAHTGLAGDSTAYGVNAANGQLSFSLSPPDTETFFLTVVPEPSTFAIFAFGLLGLLSAVRRKRTTVRVR
ncbi:MAG TPA: PEP-CTERM sorting domain-containing protein [Verrucomicrobiae bacterium]|nr:PEP-CTERM sorting domain-containing protein [Verrucomicrobiae bacterium]